jgi:hypothetical protein
MHIFYASDVDANSAAAGAVRPEAAAMLAKMPFSIASKFGTVSNSVVLVGIRMRNSG